MASVIHFKFKSSLIGDTVNFDGDYLSVQDLKRLIAKKKGLVNSSDIDFSITNKTTGEEYTKDDAYIPKNTEVLVMKINAKPQLEALRSQGGMSSIQRSTGLGTSSGLSSRSEGSSALPFSSSASLPNVVGDDNEADEETLLKKMMEEQSAEWLRNQQQRRPVNHYTENKRFGPWASSNKPPPHYICNRCEQPGHWKKDCPTIGDSAFDERKIAVGVPICRTRVLADQSGAGAGLDVMRLPDGRLVQCVPAEADFEKAIGSGKQMVNVPPDGSIPKELQCAITKDVAENAHILPCCQSNVSLSAITPILEDRATCPICLQPDISLDMLKPNLRLRETVRTFLKTALDRGISLKRPIKSDNKPSAPSNESDNKSVDESSEALKEVQEQILSAPEQAESAKKATSSSDSEADHASGQGQDKAASPPGSGGAGAHESGRSQRSRRPGGSKRKRRKAAQQTQTGGHGANGHFGMGSMQGFGSGLPGRGGNMPVMHRSGAGAFSAPHFGGMAAMPPHMQMLMNGMGNPMMGGPLNGMQPWLQRGMMPLMPGREVGANNRWSGDRSLERDYRSDSGRSYSRSPSRSRSRVRSRSRSRSTSRGRSRRSRSRSRSRGRNRSRSWDRDRRRRGFDGSSRFTSREYSRDRRSRSLERDTDRRKGGEKDVTRSEGDGAMFQEFSNKKDRDVDRFTEDVGKDRGGEREKSRKLEGTSVKERRNDSEDRWKGDLRATLDKGVRSDRGARGSKNAEEGKTKRLPSKELEDAERRAMMGNAELIANQSVLKERERRFQISDRKRPAAEPALQEEPSNIKMQEIDAAGDGEYRADSERGSLNRLEMSEREKKRRERFEKESSDQVSTEQSDNRTEEALPSSAKAGGRRLATKSGMEPYRPPMALMSKRAAAGQEKSRLSSQISLGRNRGEGTVMDRLGTSRLDTASQEASGRSRSSSAAGSSKRMRSGDVTVTVRL